MKRFILKLIYIISIAIVSNNILAQSLDQAKKLYNEGQFEEAMPVFERLVERQPNNSSYNHWYGVCCFETGDLERAEKHLEIAVKRRVQESFRYMGELYFRTYRFEQAVEMYDEYISMLAKKRQDTQVHEQRRDLARKGQRMLERVESVQVIDSIVVDKNNFLSAYHLSRDIGTIESYNDFFNTNSSTMSSVFMNQKGDKIYYAKKGEDNSYYLYNQSRLLDSWGDEKRLPVNINGESVNNNFPFVLTDGATIYYGSEGHDPLGGYDIYVTRYNHNQDSYLTPEQLGMPYNSIYNDYMLVIDEVKNIGWFVSDRFQPEDKVCVYLFIPDASRNRIESDDIEMKRSRAEMRSISETWTEYADYSELIALAYREDLAPIKPKNDFDFVINDDIIYHTLSDIKSSEAKSYYEKVVDIRKQIEELSEELNKNRIAYTNGSTEVRNRLKETIIQQEVKFEELISQPQVLEKRARNAEIIFLRNK
jgi:hypothetical protein